MTMMGQIDLGDPRALKSRGFELVRKFSGRHSDVLEYRSPEQSSAVIVKRISDALRTENAKARIQYEFESLKTVRGLLPPHLLGTVPKPLMVLPDSKTLVLEALSGTPLNVILRQEANRVIGPFRRARMFALGRMIGEWLSALHEATRTEPIPHESVAFLDDIDQRLTRCRIVGLTDDIIKQLRRGLSEASYQLEGQPIPTAARQGDFIPQNILVDGDRLGIVDFESFCQPAPIYDDAATFVAYLQGLSAFPYYSEKALRRLGDSFLEAYGLNDKEPLVRLYLARSLVILLSELNSTHVWYGQRRLGLLQTQLQRVCAELPLICAA